MHTKIIYVIALAFSLAFSQSALADSWCCGERLRTMVESLKLNAAQKEKIKPILDQLKLDMNDKRSQMPGLETQLNQQVESSNMNQTTVDDLVNKKTKLIGDMMKAKIMAKNQIYTILDTQQKTELQNMMKKLEEKISAKFKSCHGQD